MLLKLLIVKDKQNEYLKNVFFLSGQMVFASILKSGIMITSMIVSMNKSKVLLTKLVLIV